MHAVNISGFNATEMISEQGTLTLLSFITHRLIGFNVSYNLVSGTTPEACNVMKNQIFLRHSNS